MKSNLKTSDLRQEAVQPAESDTTNSMNSKENRLCVGQLANLECYPAAVGNLLH